MRNIGIALAVTTVILIAFFYGFYTLGSQASKSTLSQAEGLKVGDTFTYNLTGSTVLGSGDTVIPAEFYQYNETNYFRVTVTEVNGTQVDLSTTWAFYNGTQVTRPQILDLSNGGEADQNGFFAVYSPDLKVNALIHPKGDDGLIVNSTSTQEFANSSRTMNYWSIEKEFIDSSDPTANTMRNEFMGVYFDEQTGILYKLTHIEFYTNPEIELTITWQLISSNVWVVQ